MPESTDAAKLSELAADISIAMLTTLDDNGNFVSRPMGQQEVEPDGTLWFFSERDSSVIAQIHGESARRRHPELVRHLDLDQRIR